MLEVSPLGVETVLGTVLRLERCACVVKCQTTKAKNEYTSLPLLRVDARHHILLAG